MKKSFLLSVFLLISLLILNFSQVKADWVQVNNGITQLNINAFTATGNSSEKYPRGNTQSNIILEAELSKTKAKLFEPIEVKFKYINNGEQVDSVYDIFEDIDDFMHFNLTDINGNTYNEKILLSPEPDIPQLRYLIAPGDTLITVMNFTIFGRYAYSDDSTYFGNRRYFPPGKYYGYAHVEHDIFNKKVFDPPLKSNNIEFEISELTSEDKEMSEMYKQHKYEEIKEKYSNNNFIEQVYREEIREILGNVEKKLAPYSSLMEAYQNYFDKFPNSFYGIHYLIRYMRSVSRNNSNAVMNSITTLIEQHPNSVISEYLSNHNTREWLKDIIVNHKFEKPKH